MEVIKPEYKESLKTNSQFVSEYIEQAQIWSKLSVEDIQAWKSSIRYLIKIGYELNEFKEDENEPIFYLTSIIQTQLSSENGDNQYKLNTSLFELGGQSDMDVDGSSYLARILRSEESDSLWLMDYLSDFKTWSKDRKRDWLFKTFEAEDPEGLYETLEQIIKRDLFDLNIRSKNGQLNLFDVMLKAGNVAAVNLLLDHGFDVNNRCFDCEGESSMHHVVTADLGRSEEMYEIILKMIEVGGDLDLRDMSGLTPIHWAIKEKNEHALTAFMREESEFITIMPIGKKELNYLEYFKQKWTDDPENDFMLVLMKRTSLEHAPTKEEAKAAEEEAKTTKKEKKKESKKGKKNKD